MSVCVGAAAAVWVMPAGTGPELLLAAILGAGLAFAALGSWFLMRDAPGQIRTEGVVCLALAAIGAAVWTGISPPDRGWTPDFNVTTPDGEAAPVERTIMTTWESARSSIRMHSPVRSGANLPPSRIRSDVSAGARSARSWRFHYTQPRWAVYDDEDRVRTAPDGVLVRVRAISRDAEDLTLYEAHHNPYSDEEARAWQERQVQLPPGTVELEVEVDTGPPGSNAWNDHVFFAPGRVAPVPDGLMHRAVEASGVAGRWAGPFWVLVLVFAILHRGCLLAGRRYRGYAALATAPEMGRGRLRARHWAVGLGAALVFAVGIAAWTAPHANSWTTPVIVLADASEDASLSVRWGDGTDEVAPLIRRETPAGGDEWIGVLPSRPSYDATLKLRAGTDPVTPRSIEFVNVRDLDDHSRRFELDAPEIASGETGQVALGIVGPSASEIRRSTWVLGVAALTFIVIAAFAAMCFGSLRAPALLTHTSRPWGRPGLKLVLTVWLLATGFHLYITMSQPVSLTSDSRMYLLQTLGLMQSGDAHIGGVLYTLNRIPGYAAVMATVLGAGGMALSAVALVQGLVYVSAILFLAISSRRFIAAPLAALALAAGLLTPPVLWSSVQILTESLFASLSMLAVGSLLMHVTSSGRRAQLWLVAFALIAACAVAVRPNGVLLIPLCAAAAAPAIMHRFWSAKGISRAFAAALLASSPYVAACIPPAATAVAWAARNQVRFDFPKTTDMRPISDMVELMAAGVFDPRALDDDGYRIYVEGQRRQQYAYHIWHLRADYTQHLREQGHPITSAWIPGLHDWTAGVAADSRALSPMAHRAIAIIRTAKWALTLPDNSYDGIRRLNRQPWLHTNIDEQWLDGMEARATHDDSRFIYDRRFPPGWITDTLAPLSNAHHPTVHIALFAVASIFGVILVFTGRLWLALPWLFYLGNFVAITYLGQFRPRYTHPMEALLVFQICIGLTAIFARRHRTPDLPDSPDTPDEQAGPARRLNHRTSDSPASESDVPPNSPSGQRVGQ